MSERRDGEKRLLLLPLRKAISKEPGKTSQDWKATRRKLTKLHKLHRDRSAAPALLTGSPRV